MKEASLNIYGHEIRACAKVDEEYFLGQWQAVENGSYEPDLYKVMDEYISSDTICLDLGAYIGYTCLYMACIANMYLHLNQIL